MSLAMKPSTTKRTTIESKSSAVTVWIKKDKIIINDIYLLVFNSFIIKKKIFRSNQKCVG